VFLKYARLWEYRLRTRRGEVIHLPAFDEDPRTWQRQDGRQPDAGRPAPSVDEGGERPEPPVPS